MSRIGTGPPERHGFDAGSPCPVHAGSRLWVRRPHAAGMRCAKRLHASLLLHHRNTATVLGGDRRVPFTVDRGDLAADRLRARAALPKKAGANYRNDRRRRQFRQISGLSSSSRRSVRGCLKPVVESKWTQGITEQINGLLAADLLQNFLIIRPTQPRIVLLAPETGPASRPDLQAALGSHLLFWAKPCSRCRRAPYSLSRRTMRNRRGEAPEAARAGYFAAASAASVSARFAASISAAFFSTSSTR